MMGFIWKDLISFSLCVFTFHSFVHVLKNYMLSNHRMSLKTSKKERGILFAATLTCRWWLNASAELLTEALPWPQEDCTCACPVFYSAIMSASSDDRCSIKAKIRFTITVSAPEMPLLSCHLLFMNLVQRQMFHILIRKRPWFSVSRLIAGNNLLMESRNCIIVRTLGTSEYTAVSN